MKRKRIFYLFALVALSACVAAAQVTAPGQASTSMAPQAGAQANAPSAAPSSSARTKASTASSASSKKATSPVTIAEGTKIDATLVSWLDARKSRIGDPVQARIEQDVKQGGKVVLKKGTQLAGHVTAARTRSASQGQSQVGVSFERALLPNGQSIPFHASIVALSAPQPTGTTGAGARDAMASGGGMGATQASARSGAASGAAMNTSNAVSSSSSGAANAAVRSSGAVGGPVSSGRLSSNSKGVFGLEGLSLGSTKSSASLGSTIVSTTKNVRLNSGTEMLLRTSAQAK